MDENAKTILVLAAGSILVFVGAVWYFRRYKQSFAPNNEMNYKPGFLPAYQGLYFQGMPPSLKIENDYHKKMISTSDEGGCDGDYGNFECRQKSYLKAMKNGSTDKADLICYRHRNNEDEYYACLDAVYGNYLWMDRYVGTDSCKCFGPPSFTGTKMADGSCFCPSDRPLHDRRPVDSNDDIVNRVL